MPAQTKRRRLSLLSLPIVVLAGFLLVARLAAWQQSDLVADLGDCIAHGETRDACEAVRKLAAMPNPPIPVLVSAAAADEHETAEAGQLAISRMLHRWQRDMEKNRRVGKVAGQLCELAESLDKQQNDFANADHAWLAITAGKILRLANTLPAAKTPLVAIHCDAILAAADADGAVRAGAKWANADFATKETVEKVPMSTNDKRGDNESIIANKEHEFSAVGEPTESDDGQLGKHSSENAATTTNALPDSPTSSSSQSTLKFEDDSLGAKRDEWSEDGGQNRGDKPIDDELTVDGLSPANPFTNMQWSQPMYRIAPVRSLGEQSNDKQEKQGIEFSSGGGSPNPDAAANDPLAGLDSRELLRRWRAAQDGETRPIERELAKRGFGKISAQVVRNFFSENAEERTKLVDTVLSQPGAGAGAWLRLLAEDSNAEVRLFAVTLMATSNDAALVEKAWQVSIRDRDPRIADLAMRLRESALGHCGGKRCGFGDPHITG